MSIPEPSLNDWLAEGKASENADLCGNFGLGVNNINNQEGQINLFYGIIKL